MIKAFRNPIVWFAGLMLTYGLVQIFQENNLNDVVRSDGRGYYAYLPALLIYQDGSFEESSRVERSYYQKEIDQLYLYKDSNGKTYNKYFPGMAVLQLPFFALGCVVSWISGQPVDGYSSVFLFCFYLGSLFYAVAGLFLFARSIRMLFPDYYKRARWLIPLFYIATPLLFYSLLTPSFTHLYSFFLFGMFTLQMLKLKARMNPTNMLLLGLTIGLILLVRPTNIFVVFLIPFLLGDKLAFSRFFKDMISGRAKNLSIGVLGFASMISILFLLWKWQSGQWIIWSYSGEGFNFLHPQLLASLFSFRTGLFVHTPILLLALAGIVILFRQNKFSAMFWVIYFVFNAWLISSWWCWDYESPFGNRPYTEHMFFLLLPVVALVSRYRSITIAAITVCSLIGTVRFWEKTSGFMENQRFTRASYFKSLAFWNSNNADRWNYTRSCIPFGEKISETWLLNEPHVINIEEQEAFFYTVQKQIEKPRTNERFYYRVELEKKINDSLLDGVLLVIDAKSVDETKRYYKAIDLFNDRFEGSEDWSDNLIFEGIVHDQFQDFDYITIYFWNQAGKKFSLRNVKIVLEEYKS